MDNNQFTEPQQIQPALMNRKCASRYLAISERKLWDMTKSGDIPAVRLGRAVRYDINDLNTFISNAKELKL